MEIESVFKVVASGGRRRMCGKALTPNWAKDDCDSPNSMSQKKSLESADGEFSLLMPKDLERRKNSDLSDLRWSSDLSWSWMASKKMIKEKDRGFVVTIRRRRLSER